MGPKEAMRRTGVTARTHLAQRELALAAAALAEALEPLLASATRVASYVPVGTEPGLPPREGWLLPVLLPDGDLDWARYDGRLAPAAHGLSEPPGPRLGVDAVAGCDLVLVPALLVDHGGRRLGRGGGSYDRALARATGLTVALLHDGELVDLVPTEQHDVAVAAAVTPSQGVVRLAAG